MSYLISSYRIRRVSAPLSHGLLVGCSIFAQVPESRALFFQRVDGHDTSSPKFVGHAMRVFAGLEVVINLLDQPEALASQLEHLKMQHEERHITAKYFHVSSLLTAHSLISQPISQLIMLPCR